MVHCDVAENPIYRRMPMAENDTRLIAPVDHERVIDLVLGVARLGEAGLRGWWQSHGLDQAGQYVLEALSLAPGVARRVS
jgi:hypothetical protein